MRDHHRQFECRRCGCRGGVKALGTRKIYRFLREAHRRQLNLHGSGLCRNKAACIDRAIRRAHRLAIHAALAEARG